MGSARSGRPRPRDLPAHRPPEAGARAAKGCKVPQTKGCPVYPIYRARRKPRRPRPGPEHASRPGQRTERLGPRLAPTQGGIRPSRLVLAGGARGPRLPASHARTDPSRPAHQLPPRRGNGRWTARAWAWLLPRTWCSDHDPSRAGARSASTELAWDVRSLCKGKRTLLAGQLPAFCNTRIERLLEGRPGEHQRLVLPRGWARNPCFRSHRGWDQSAGRGDRPPPAGQSGAYGPGRGPGRLNLRGRHSNQDPVARRGSPVHLCHPGDQPSRGSRALKR